MSDRARALPNRLITWLALAGATLTITMQEAMLTGETLTTITTMTALPENLTEEVEDEAVEEEVTLEEERATNASSATKKAICQESAPTKTQEEAEKEEEEEAAAQRPASNATKRATWPESVLILIAMEAEMKVLEEEGSLVRLGVLDSRSAIRRNIRKVSVPTKFQKVAEKAMK
jgi:hypothetical protein